MHIYTQELYSVQFKMNLKVVIMINTRNGKYVLLASTNPFQNALEIIQFYSLRFQIEFLFRDAKQFTGLTHCQARSEEKLDFHFNMSLAAINLYQTQMKLNGLNNTSMNCFVRKAYNTKLVNLLFDQLNSKAELNQFFDINQPDIQKIINLGQVVYKKAA
ncbi:MAG: transposase [Bacteroidota bacterium]